MRFRLGCFSISLLLIFGIFVVYFAYLKSTYVDEKINVGSGYGFSIGDTKNNVYEKARQLYSAEVVFIRHPIRYDGYGPMIRFNFGDEEYKKIENSDKWVFYFDKRDFIRLTFRGDKLVSIHRRRQEFELT